MLKRPSFYIAIFGILAVILLVTRLRQSGPEPQPLVPPSQSPYADSVGGRGLVESMNENVRLAPNASGLVAEVKVRVGDLVKKSDVLFLLDERQATAAMRTSEAEVAAQQARVAEAETLLADRLDQRDRTHRLRAKGVASEDEMRREDFAWQAATRQLARTRADLDLATAQAENTRIQRELLTTRAPRDGTILAVNIRAGEFANASGAEPAVLLGDLTKLQLRADVDESDAPRVRAGGPAVAFLKGTRSDPIALEFVRIEPYVLPKRSLSGESTERVDTRVLQVIYQFQAPAFPIFVGQQMDVFLNVERLQ